MKLRITVQGQAYEVDVEVVDAGGSPSVAPTGGGCVCSGAASGDAGSGPGCSGGSAAGEKACRAPIPGNITQVKVAVGQMVALNETVVVLEAMKMETPIHSPLAGKVKAVNVASGDSVKQGQVLVEFE